MPSFYYDSGKVISQILQTYVISVQLFKKHESFLKLFRTTKFLNNPASSKFTFPAPSNVCFNMRLVRMQIDKLESSGAVNIELLYCIYKCRLHWTASNCPSFSSQCFLCSCLLAIPSPSFY